MVWAEELGLIPNREILGHIFGTDERRDRSIRNSVAGRYRQNGYFSPLLTESDARALWKTNAARVR